MTRDEMIDHRLDETLQDVVSADHFARYAIGGNAPRGSMPEECRLIDLLEGPSVPVYRMADQEFCELKVDLEIRHPELERRLRALPEASEQLERTARGKEFHETMAATAKAISADDVQGVIASRLPFTLIEASLHGNFGRLPLVGKPGALHFYGKGSAWVIEHKVRDRPYLIPSDDAQLRLYGFLLTQDNRFVVDRLSLVCLITAGETAAKAIRFPESRRVGIVQTVCKEPPGPRERRRRWDDIRVRGLGTSRLRAATFRYDPEKARNELTLLSGYWLGARPPIPTRKPQKCSVCGVNALGLCPIPRAKYGDRVRHGKTG
jgi:hypothetical protein